MFERILVTVVMALTAASGALILIRAAAAWEDCAEKTRTIWVSSAMVAIGAATILLAWLL